MKDRSSIPLVSWQTLDHFWFYVCVCHVQVTVWLCTYTAKLKSYASDAPALSSTDKRPSIPGESLPCEAGKKLKEDRVTEVKFENGVGSFAKELVVKAFTYVISRIAGVLCFLLRPMESYFRRLTFLSGSGDTNAGLCLFLRYMYTFAPKEVAFDEQEQFYAPIFLSFHFRVLALLIRNFGMRIMPPLLRPLYVSYFGRATHVQRFVVDTLRQDKVEQLIILGSGFDTTAYRMRNLPRADGPASIVYEVDRASVQEAKLRMLHEKLTPQQFAHITENVKFVPCEFGVEEIDLMLSEHGFDRSKSFAIVWEGVSYYLSVAALHTTIYQLRKLQKGLPPSLGKTQPGEAVAHTRLDASSFYGDRESATTASATDSASAVSASSNEVLETSSEGLAAAPGAETEENAITASGRADVSEATLQQLPRLFMDYMLNEQLTSLSSNQWLWRLMTNLAHVQGTAFISGFTNVRRELGDLGIIVTKHTPYTELQEEFKAQTSKMDYFTVFHEPGNALQHHHDTCLGLVEGRLLPLLQCETPT